MSTSEKGATKPRRNRRPGWSSSADRFCSAAEFPNDPDDSTGVVDRFSDAVAICSPPAPAAAGHAPVVWRLQLREQHQVPPEIEFAVRDTVCSRPKPKTKQDCWLMTANV